MENIVKTEQLYEGKAKKVFATNDPDLVIVDYKDDATAFNGEKKGTIVGKGAINNKMTNYMFKLLEKEGIPTHLVEEISDRETIVKKVEIVPLEVIVRNAVSRKAQSSSSLHLSSATSATSLATHSSTSIMLLVLVLLLRKRSRISQSMLSR